MILANVPYDISPLVFYFLSLSPDELAPIIAHQQVAFECSSTIYLWHYYDSPHVGGRSNASEVPSVYTLVFTVPSIKTLSYIWFEPISDAVAWVQSSLETLLKYPMPYHVDPFDLFSSNRCSANLVCP